jgi:hypothetical protein
MAPIERKPGEENKLPATPDDGLVHQDAINQLLQRQSSPTDKERIAMYDREQEAAFDWLAKKRKEEADKSPWVGAKGEQSKYDEINVPEKGGQFRRERLLSESSSYAPIEKAGYGEKETGKKGGPALPKDQTVEVPSALKPDGKDKKSRDSGVGWGEVISGLSGGAKKALQSQQPSGAPAMLAQDSRLNSLRQLPNLDWKPSDYMGDFGGGVSSDASMAALGFKPGRITSSEETKKDKKRQEPSEIDGLLSSLRASDSKPAKSGMPNIDELLAKAQAKQDPIGSTEKAIRDAELMRDQLTQQLQYNTKSSPYSPAQRTGAAMPDSEARMLLEKYPPPPPSSQGLGAPPTLPTRPEQFSDDGTGRPITWAAGSDERVKEDATRQGKPALLKKPADWVSLMKNGWRPATDDEKAGINARKMVEEDTARNLKFLEDYQKKQAAGGLTPIATDSEGPGDGVDGYLRYKGMERGSVITDTPPPTVPMPQARQKVAPKYDDSPRPKNKPLSTGLSKEETDRVLGPGTGPLTEDQINNLHRAMDGKSRAEKEKAASKPFAMALPPFIKKGETMLPTSRRNELYDYITDERGKVVDIRPLREKELAAQKAEAEMRSAWDQQKMDDFAAEEKKRDAMDRIQNTLIGIEDRRRKHRLGGSVL